MKSKYSIMISIIMLGNCLSTGKMIKGQDIDKIIEKKTTRPEVESILGKPSSTSSSAGFTTYSYAGCQSNGLYWIPILGLFLGSTECNNASVSFDKDGIVNSKSFGETKTSY